MSASLQCIKLLSYVIINCGYGALMEITWFPWPWICGRELPQADTRHVFRSLMAMCQNFLKSYVYDCF